MTSNANTSSSNDILNLDDDLLILDLGLDNDLYDDSYLGLDLMATSGTNTLDGTDEDDSVVLDGGTNTVNTGLGDDFVDIIGGTNTVSLGDGNDFAYLDGGINPLNLGVGNDQIYASDGDSTIDGGTGNDTIGAYYGYGGVYEADWRRGLLTPLFCRPPIEDGIVYSETYWHDDIDAAVDDGPDTRYITITDFQSGEDVIELNGTTFDGLTLEQDGNDTKVFDEDNLLAILQNVTPDQLSANDFATNYWGRWGTPNW